MKLGKLLKQYDWKNYVIYYGMWSILTVFLIWCVASYFNILAHNTLGDQSYCYWKYNILIMMFDFFNKLLG